MKGRRNLVHTFLVCFWIWLQSLSLMANFWMWSAGWLRCSLTDSWRRCVREAAKELQSTPKYSGINTILGPRFCTVRDKFKRMFMLQRVWSMDCKRSQDSNNEIAGCGRLQGFPCNNFGSSKVPRGLRTTGPPLQVRVVAGYSNCLQWKLFVQKRSNIATIFANTSFSCISLMFMG